MLRLNEPRGDFLKALFFVRRASVGAVDPAHVVRPVGAKLPVVAGFGDHETERAGLAEGTSIAQAKKWTLHLTLSSRWGARRPACAARPRILIFSKSPISYIIIYEGLQFCHNYLKIIGFAFVALRVWRRFPCYKSANKMRIPRAERARRGGLKKEKEGPRISRINTKKEELVKPVKFAVDEKFRGKFVVKTEKPIGKDSAFGGRGKDGK